MTSVAEPAKFASWISPPKVGIDNKPGDFEYVKIEFDARAGGKTRAARTARCCAPLARSSATSAPNVA